MIVAAGPVIPNFGQGTRCEIDNGTFCLSWVEDHWSDTLWPALWQHIELALIAVAIGFAISFLLALAGLRYRVIDAPIGYWADFLYTIPSLALFQLLVPITGLTTLTVEIALVSYTLLVLYRNMVEGLRAVPAEVLESARGAGFTRTQTFLQVELPLATPTIMAGVRIATVSTISIATVAAFVLPKGLGYPLFNALREDTFKTEIFAAGILAVALALTADGLLHLLERALTPWARRERRA